MFFNFAKKTAFLFFHRKNTLIYAHFVQKSLVLLIRVRVHFIIFTPTSYNTCVSTYFIGCIAHHILVPIFPSYFFPSGSSLPDILQFVIV